MRHHGLVAFAATVTIVAPLVVPRLTAGPKQEAMAFAPGSRSLVVDGIGVEATLDKVVGDPGETVQLHLEADRKVTVGIVMLGSTGTEGARVPDPPLGLLHENVTIDVADGEHVRKDIPIKLAGAVSRSAFASYSIYVMTPKGAKRLARLQRNADGPVDCGEGPPCASETESALFQALSSINREVEPDKLEREDREFPLGSAARLDAMTRPRDARIGLAMPETAPPNVPFDVTVTVSNPTNEAIDSMWLAPEVPQTNLDYRGLDGKDLDIEPANASVSLAPHESKRVTFKVTAKTIGALALVVDTYNTGAAFGAVEITDEMPAPRYVLGMR